MALELKKVNIRANRLGEAVNSQALVEGEIALEGGAEAIARMLFKMCIRDSYVHDARGTQRHFPGG